jgi:amicoumacin kinase
MEESITAQLTPELVAAVAGQWQALGEAKLLDDVTNFVYEFESPQGRRILRLTPSSHHTEAEVTAELDWVNFLVEHGVRAARPVPSVNARLIETHPTGGAHFIAAVFEFAPGRFINSNNPQEWHPGFFRTFGRTVGQLHAVTQHYTPPGLQRAPWYADDLLSQARDYLPADQQAVAAEVDRLVAKFRALPPSPDSYGLVHNDLNPTNFFVDDGQITLFDFDDCAYNWFFNDIAVTLPLYNQALFAAEGWEARVTEFFQHFMRGYAEENHLAPQWLEYLPDSLRLQNMITLIACYKANVPNSQYRPFFELVLRICQQGHPLFTFDFRKAWERRGA